MRTEDNYYIYTYHSKYLGETIESVSSSHPARVVEEFNLIHKKDKIKKTRILTQWRRITQEEFLIVKKRLTKKFYEQLSKNNPKRV